MLCKVILRLQGSSHSLSLCMESLSMTIQLKSTEQHLTGVLFLMLCKVVLMFEFVELKWGP